MSDCLHCDIGELIAEHIKKRQQPVDMAELASMIAQALAEFILSAPQHEQAILIAECLTTIGLTFLDKPDDAERPHKPH
ncbi:MAG: hypothetical protein QOF14_5409 [Hyphomicrobiales bacterium]|jgi:hypothetical protein|nr:hypothetical protein [Hyphomicrobiales bacterium]